MVRIKVCGITRVEDARDAVNAGVDALGFVFYPRSPRYIQPEDARRIITRLPPFVTSVGVFVDQELSEVLAIIQTSGIGVVQLHGEESPEYCRTFPTKVIKAFRVRDPRRLQETVARYHVDAILLDTYAPDAYGGTGATFPWNSAAGIAQYGPVILAGGLTPENVQEAVAHVSPYAVDVSSGVETRPGYKDAARIREFVQRVRQCNL